MFALRHIHFGRNNLGSLKIDKGVRDFLITALRRDHRPDMFSLTDAQCHLAAHGLLLLGDIATHPVRFDAESGAAHYREALALGHLHGMRPVIAHCHLGLGRLYRRTGQPEHARENLATAMTMYREMDMDFWLEQGEADVM